jgi:hypothetical protein
VFSGKEKQDAKKFIERAASDPAAAVVAASARVRVEPAFVGCTWAQFDPGRRHLFLRMVGCAERF